MWEQTSETEVFITEPSILSGFLNIPLDLKLEKNGEAVYSFFPFNTDIHLFHHYLDHENSFQAV